MNKDEALKLAIDALDSNDPTIQLRVALTLRAALVEPEQEPVAWLVTYGGLTHIAYTKPTQVADTHYQPLYAAQL